MHFANVVSTGLSFVACGMLPALWEYPLVNSGTIMFYGITMCV